MSGQEIVVQGETRALATMETAPKAVLEEAQKAAAALKDVIARKPRPVVINGEQYLEYEDWATIARFYGVTAGLEVEPEYVELGGARGFKATSVALRNGQVISRATAFCLNDEERWDKAPTYQIASMAQTRANAKVLRNVLSWVAVLAGYRPTPAEEMDGVRSAPRAAGPQCPKCGPKGKVVASKYAAKDGSHPWVCLECKAKWGNADAKSAPAGTQGPDGPDDEWHPDTDEPGSRG